MAPSSRLKTWSCWPARKAKIFETCAGRLKIETATTHFHHSRRRCMATKWNHPLNDGTPRRAGFMIAASADMGRFMTWLPFLRSTMKTWGWPLEPSQTETKASDSMAQDCAWGFRSFRERRGAHGGKGCVWGRACAKAVARRARKPGERAATQVRWRRGSRTPNLMAFAETPKLGRLSTSLNVNGICCAMVLRVALELRLPRCDRAGPLAALRFRSYAAGPARSDAARAASFAKCSPSPDANIPSCISRATRPNFSRNAMHTTAHMTDVDDRDIA